MAKKQEDTGNQLLENPEAIAEQISKTEEFIRENKNSVFTIGTAVAVLIAVVMGFRYYNQAQEIKAQGDMFNAIFAFEAGELDVALVGDGDAKYGFEEIIAKYGRTDAANLSSYYSGVIYLQKGEYQKAIDYLEDFSAGDLAVQARAYSLIGDAYSELEDATNAASQYMKAANYKANKNLSPRYLIKAAIAYESMDNLTEAKSAYDKIVNDYYGSSDYQEAKKQQARLEGLLKK